MEGSTTNADLSAEELRNAGASDLYVAYYQTAKQLGIETNSTRHAERVVREGVSYSGGGFHEALWAADPRFPNGPNPYGADGTNQEILSHV